MSYRDRLQDLVLQLTKLRDDQQEAEIKDVMDHLTALAEHGLESDARITALENTITSASGTSVQQLADQLTGAQAAFQAAVDATNSQISALSSKIDAQQAQIDDIEALDQPAPPTPPAPPVEIPPAPPVEVPPTPPVETPPTETPAPPSGEVPVEPPQ